jgi:histidinol phosphatase-like PHP family hydrolase
MKFPKNMCAKSSEDREGNMKAIQSNGKIFAISSDDRTFNI